MKKSNPQSALSHQTAPAEAAVLTAPTPRHMPKRRKPQKVGRTVLSAPPHAGSALELKTPLNARAALGTARPASSSSGERQHALDNGPAVPLPGTLAPEEVELKLLIEALYLQSGFDFRNYRPSIVRERLAGFLKREGFPSISALQAVVLREPPVLERLLVCLTERQLPLFGDPAFYRVFRREILPWLRTYPFARIWVAGCGTGGEAYSLATVLWEEGLQERCRIYATDFCESVLQQARTGLWPLSELACVAANHHLAGGRHPFAQLYTTENGQGRLLPALGRNIVFAAHNLLTDASFNEFHLILCRTALEDFDPILQSQVHDLLYGSLAPRGVLALGGPHALQSTLHLSDYEPISTHEGLYRKNRPHDSL